MADIIGIDVSKHNGTLNWTKIKAAGIKFAILRAGYGTSTVDPQFAANAKGALAQGIPIGVYWFSYALSAEGAKNEAKKCLETIKGYNVTLPVFFDFEYDTVTYAAKKGVTLGKTAFNAHTVAFCENIKAAGYTPGVYYNLDYYKKYVDSSKIGGYVQWFARYSSKPGISSYDLWQYSSSGTISGHSCKFDMNKLANTSLLTGTTKKTETVTPTVTKPTVTEPKTEEETEVRYNYLKEVPDTYKTTLTKLITKGVLKGKGGTGDELILDMNEDSVRLLVILDRAGVFD